MSRKQFTYNEDKLARMKRHSKSQWHIFQQIDDEHKEQRKKVQELTKRQEDINRKMGVLPDCLTERGEDINAKKVTNTELPELVEAKHKLAEIEADLIDPRKKAQEFGAVISEMETAIQNWGGISSTRAL